MTAYTFTFAYEGAPSRPWAHLLVVRFHGQEALSTPYRYDITVLAQQPDAGVDPRDLAGKRATLRIATLTEPAYKVVHGILTEVEEVCPVRAGMLYRIVLQPPLVRASHRTHGRIFSEKTLREIVSTVLHGDPHLEQQEAATVQPDRGVHDRFNPAAEQLTWRMTDPSRVDDVRVRPYCVQYKESDLAFVSHILEDEGISYHFENGEGKCLLVLSDTDSGKVRIDPFLPLGPDIEGRQVTRMRLGARVREAVFATGEGHCRMLSAGSVFALEHAQGRYEGEYLVTALEVHGEQQGILPVPLTQASVPFRCWFEAVRPDKRALLPESWCRPARVAPRPHIDEVQAVFEHVTHGSTSRVDADRTESTGGHRIMCVQRNNTETVHGEESITVSANQTAAIVGHRNVTVGADHAVNVACNRTVSVGENESIAVYGDQRLSVGGNRTIGTAGDHVESVAGSATLTVVGSQSVHVAGAVSRDATADVSETAGGNLAVRTGASTKIQAGAALCLTAAAQALLQGANVSVSASGEIVLAAGGSAVKIGAAGIELAATAIKIAGGAVDIVGGVIKHN